MTTKVIPYLVMDGTAREAISFYQTALGAEVLHEPQTFGENISDEFPAEAKDLVMHATIKIGESDIMFSDNFPGQPHTNGSQITLCITCDNKEKSQQMFNALADGGQVGMELQETFFSPLYGMVTDKFGITFQIYTEGGQK